MNVTVAVRAAVEVLGAAVTWTGLPVGSAPPVRLVGETDSHAAELAAWYAPVGEVRVTVPVPPSAGGDHSAGVTAPPPCTALTA